MNGVLHLQSEWLLSSGLFPFSEPKRMKWEMTSVDYQAKWSSARELTLEYLDVKKVAVDYVTCIGLDMKGGCGEQLFDRMHVLPKNGHYDDNGCFRFQGYCTFGEVSVVVSPLRFKRVQN